MEKNENFEVKGKILSLIQTTFIQETEINRTRLSERVETDIALVPSKDYDSRIKRIIYPGATGLRAEDFISVNGNKTVVEGFDLLGYAERIFRLKSSHNSEICEQYKLIPTD